MGFLDGIVSPGTFHNGTDYRIFLSLPHFPVVAVKIDVLTFQR